MPAIAGQNQDLTISTTFRFALWMNASFVCFAAPVGIVRYLSESQQVDVFVETLDDNTDAWWLSRTGSRMTPRAIDLVIRKLADKGRGAEIHVAFTCQEEVGLRGVRQLYQVFGRTQQVTPRQFRMQQRES